MCARTRGGTPSYMSETPQDAVDPQPDDAPSTQDPATAEQPDPKEAGAAGWQAIAPPGKPDGEVDTR